ncbi:TetR/AcrR family transcriptional regulator [Acetobacter nitrogenifigens]|nr:TetR/AcrR family transcriptional regulator [Acetobacter nitrogenifigens]
MKPQTAPRKRLSRTEQQAETRQEILATAGALFARVGFGGASLEAIASEAGYSKGAIYSNFESKEHLFLEVMKRYQKESLTSVMSIFDDDSSHDVIVDRLAAWADNLAKNGIWAFLALEYARHVGADSDFGELQTALIRDNWWAVGKRLRPMFNSEFPGDDEMLGALVFELTHAPLSGIAASPTVGQLLRLTFNGLLAAYGVQKKNGGSRKKFGKNP